MRRIAWLVGSLFACGGDRKPPPTEAPPPRPVTAAYCRGQAAAVATQTPLADVTGSTIRPANTFSIVARDPATGDLGVAVQSHWFSVGSIVTWAEPGVGAVATQAFAEPSYGP